MRKLLTCGIGCALLSVWAIVQLSLMGIFYKIESDTLLHDVIPDDEFDSTEDLVKQIEDNYNNVAINCWLAACIYLVTLVLSFICICKAKRDIKLEAIQLHVDDEHFCINATSKSKTTKKEVKGKLEAEKKSKMELTDADQTPK